MAKIRKWVAYRRLERPYTRRSKYKKNSFVKTTPVKKIVRFDMGNLKGEFSHAVSLIAKTDLQIRDSAIEAGRQTCNRLLEKTIGKNDYYLKLRLYPHHILRENPLAAGAGADRMSTGMKAAFGKSIGNAARVMKGQIICQVRLDKLNLKTGREALKRFSHKMPCSCAIEVEEREVKEKAKVEGRVKVKEKA